MSTTVFDTTARKINLDTLSFRKWATVSAIVVSDLVALSSAGIIGFLLRHSMSGRLLVSEYLPFFPFLIVFFFVFAVVGLYSGVMSNQIVEFQKLTTGTTFAFLILVCFSSFTKQSNYSRILFVLAWLLSIATLSICRSWTRELCGRAKWWGIPAVIMGSGGTAQTMFQFLKGNASIGLRPVAVLSETPDEISGNHESDQIVRGGFALAPEMARRHGCCYAIVAVPNSSSLNLATVLSEYAFGFHRVVVIPELGGMASLWVSASEVGGMLCLEVRQTLAHTWPQLVKRIVDITLAAIALAIFSPLFLTLWICVKLTSPGPAFYSQRRIGKKGTNFSAWKFRSMVMNADQVLNKYLDCDEQLRAEWHADHKLKQDPRVTRIGKLIRKTSLDELPQLWNVLVGEMSFVGPRPIVSAEIAKYGERYEMYQKVRPGITGLWQISGRNNTSYDSRILFDDYYVRNWSLSLDLYILTRTIKTVLFAEGAY
jgi:Undecaprenyl-phosphate galactose phosphotransferase WbaP